MANIQEESENLESQRRICCVDVYMIPCKIIFLLCGGIIGSVVPYINVFLVSVGLTPSQAGLLSGTQFVASPIANALWGLLVDYTGRRKLVLVLMCCGSALLIFPMPWIANSLKGTLGNCTYIHEHNITNIAMKNTNKTCLQGGSTGDNTTLFSVLFVVLLLGATFLLPLIGYLDSVVMNVLKARDSKATYGGQRVFVEIGEVFIVLLAGLACDNYHQAGMSNYTPVFYIFLVNVLATIPVGCYLLNQNNSANHMSETTINTQAAQNTENVSILRRLQILIKEIDVIFFFITAIISGVALSTVLYFLLLFMNDEMPATKALMSLAPAMQKICSIILFPFTTKIIERLGGTSQAIFVAILMYMVRFTIISYATVLWVVIAVQVLNSFALAWAALREHVDRIAPKEIKVTVSMILFGVHYGFCAFTSNVVGGNIYERFTGRLLFRSVGALCGVWTLIMVIYHGARYLNKRRVCHGDIESSVASGKQGTSIGTSIGISNAVEMRETDGL